MRRAYWVDSEFENEETRGYGLSLSVYGEVIVKEYRTHVRISKEDWNKFKQRLIPVLKQGDRKDASTETGS